VIRLFQDKISLLLVLLFLFPFLKVSGQTYTSSMFAGSTTGDGGFQNGVGVNARFRNPASVEFDLAGNLIISDQGNASIRRITPSGVVSTIAGTGLPGGVDGQGVLASFNSPRGLAVDRTGNIYVADIGNNKIRRITPTGVVSTFAGTGVRGYSDGPALSSQFSSPYEMAFDNDENLYVIDALNFRIRRITPSGIVSTFAGSGSQASIDGVGINASFDGLIGIVFNPEGFFLVTEIETGKIRRITMDGTVSTFAGSTPGYQDGSSSTAQFDRPWGIDMSSNGYYFITDMGNRRIRMISPQGVVSTISGNGSPGFNTGNIASSNYTQPTGIRVASNGLVYVSDNSDSNIRLLTPSCLTPPAPTLSAGSALTFCQGGSVILYTNNPPPPRRILWSTGDTTQSINVRTGGTYTVRIIEGACTSAASNALTVVVQDSTATPNIAVTRSTLCNAENAYILQGTARASTDCNAGIRLTSNNQRDALGYAWYRTRIDLTNSFQLQFNANFGIRDLNGADGIVAIFQNDPRGQNAVGLTGGSLGMSGVTPSFGVEFDTFDNTATNSQGDLNEDHIAFNVNGQVQTPLLPAVPALPNGANIEDGRYHNVKILWNATSQTMQVYFDGNLRTSFTGDIVTRFFNNNPLVYWGFSATTGGSQNDQSICGAFFFYDNNQDGEPDQENDYPVLEVQNPDTAATYIWSDFYKGNRIFASTLGNYSVRAIKGACTSRVSNVVNITSNTPVAPLVTPAGPVTFCQGDSVTLTSNVEVGNIWSTGARTQSIVVRTAGRYTVNQVDRACTSFTSIPVLVNIITAPPPPTITANRTTTICLGDSVILTSSWIGRNTWSTGDTTRSIVVRSAGNYTVQAFNGNCRSLPSVALGVVVTNPPDGPNLLVAGITEFCEGGSVVLTSSFVNDNIWSNGATTQSITVTTSGNYFVRQRIGTCLSNATDTVTITVFPTPPTPLVISSRPTTFCDGDSTTLVGPTAVSYLWSTGETTQQVTARFSRVYTLRTISAEGCTSLRSSPTGVIVNPIPPQPTITASGALQFCEGGTVTLNAPISADYIWSNGATTASITVNTSQTITLRILSAAGCSSIASNPVEVVVFPTPPTPAITSLTPLAFCEDDSVTLEAPTFDRYLWSTGATTQRVKVAGTRQVTLQLISNNSCTSAISAPVATLEYRKPTPVVIGNTSICPGLAGVIYRLAPDTMRITNYNWIIDGGTILGSANADTVIINWSAIRRNDAAVKVITRNANGCFSDTSKLDVRINPRLLSPIPTGDTVICGNNLVRTYTTTATISTLYTWTIEGGTVISPSNSNSVTVQWDANPSILKQIKYRENIIADTICEGNSPFLRVRVSPRPDTTLQIEGTKNFCGPQQLIRLSLRGLPNSAYRWVLSAGIDSIRTIDSIIELRANAIGTYPISVLETSKDGCVGKIITDTIRIFPIPVALTGANNKVCSQSTIILGESIEPALTYRWSPGNLVSDSTISQPIFTGSAVGTTNLALIVQNRLTGCLDTAQLAIETFEKPAIPVINIIGEQTFCQGGSVQLFVPAVTLPLKYRWSTGDTTQQITVSQTANIRLVAINASGCQSDTSAIVPIVVNPLPARPSIVAVTDSILCNDSLFIIQAPTAVKYLWSTGDTTQSISLRNEAAITLQVFNEFGCISPASAPINLQYVTVAKPDLSGNNEWLCPGNLQGITYAVPSNPTSKFTWRIFGGTLLADTGEIVTVNWERGNSLPRSITVTEQNQRGCFSEPSTIIIQYDSLVNNPASGCELGNYGLKIPNVLTANGDGKNDKLIISNLEFYPNSNLKIFNRYGSLLYSEDNYNNNYGAEGLNQGMYYYLFTTNRGVSVKGWLMIIKE
jgi:gliding motility-associated-like protein